MKRIKVTYFALAAFISAVSCSKETAEPDVYEWAEGDIHFKTSLAKVTSTRALDMTLDNLESFQVTCFNSGDIKDDTDGIVSPYFEDATFIRKETPVATTYESSSAEEPREWPSTNGLIEFYAFSPSRYAMAAHNSAINDANASKYFKLSNNTISNSGNLATDYRLGAVRINPDISSQYDFITAATSGERWKDFSNEVELSFSHQMSQVELRAWGEGYGYDFEIAGVRIGNPVVEDNFVFSDGASPESAPKWEGAESSVKDNVEYVYRAPDATTLIGDTIYCINKEEHNSIESATSIMGRGGCAMVIPTVNPKWEGLADPNIASTPYTTDKTYFSILMRVVSSGSRKQLYPYPDNPDGLTIVYYAVDEEGAIVARVYPGASAGSYFADSTLHQPYEAEDGIEIREFGWAAMPVDADWSAGKRYVYTLDYSEGIGVHDPQDPKPGTPIKGLPEIKWGMTITTWAVATPNEDYTPDIEIP